MGGGSSKKSNQDDAAERRPRTTSSSSHTRESSGGSRIRERPSYENPSHVQQPKSALEEMGILKSDIKVNRKTSPEKFHSMSFKQVQQCFVDYVALATNGAGVRSNSNERELEYDAFCELMGLDINGFSLKLFSSFDMDGQQSLDFQEFLLLCAYKDPNISLAQKTKFVHRLSDLNHDGTVSMSEFFEFLDMVSMTYVTNELKFASTKVKKCIQMVPEIADPDYMTYEDFMLLSSKQSTARLIFTTIHTLYAQSHPSRAERTKQKASRKYTSALALAEDKEAFLATMRKFIDGSFSREYITVVAHGTMLYTDFHMGFESIEIVEIKQHVKAKGGHTTGLAALNEYKSRDVNGKTRGGRLPPLKNGSTEGEAGRDRSPAPGEKKDSVVAQRRRASVRATEEAISRNDADSAPLGKKCQHGRRGNCVVCAAENGEKLPTSPDDRSEHTPQEFAANSGRTDHNIMAKPAPAAVARHKRASLSAVDQADSDGPAQVRSRSQRASLSSCDVPDSKSDLDPSPRPGRGRPQRSSLSACDGPELQRVSPRPETVLRASPRPDTTQRVSPRPETIDMAVPSYRPGQRVANQGFDLGSSASTLDLRRSPHRASADAYDSSTDEDTFVPSRGHNSKPAPKKKKEARSGRGGSRKSSTSQQHEDEGLTRVQQVDCHMLEKQRQQQRRHYQAVKDLPAQLHSEYSKLSSQVYHSRVAATSVGYKLPERELVFDRRDRERSPD